MEGCTIKTNFRNEQGIVSPLRVLYAHNVTSNIDQSINIDTGCSKKTKTIPKRYKNKRRKSLLALHVCARYKDYYIIILGANII